MLENQAAFNEDISYWEVGQVKQMRGMFRGATSFNGDLSRWNVGQVKAMDGLFKDATCRSTVTFRAGTSDR